MLKRRDRKNEASDGFLCGPAKGGRRRERYTGGERRVRVPADIREIAPDAFKGCVIEEVAFEADGSVIAFPAGNNYLLEDLLRGFGQNGRLYDFTAYDRSLESSWLDACRIRMICTRLLDPRDMPEDVQARHRERLLEKLPQILKTLAAAQDQGTLGKLVRLGIVGEENADMCIGVLRGTEAKEMMLWLMDWKQANLGETEFDFSL